jgi:hypothetical protein
MFNIYIQDNLLYDINQTKTPTSLHIYVRIHVYMHFIKKNNKMDFNALLEIKNIYL